jgi:micrococcal nuclease
MPRALSRNLASLGLGVAVMAGAAIYKQALAPDIDPVTLSSIANGGAGKALSGLPVAARPMPVCGSGKRINCVVDGDTYWLEGAKYRIANIDTPEIKGKCGAERVTAKRAQHRLVEMMDGRAVQVRITGTDRYQRTLVLISNESGDIGDRLVGEGLAEVWGGDFINWCRG